MKPEKKQMFLCLAKAKDYRAARETEAVSPDTHGVWVHFYNRATHPWLYEMLAVPLTDADFRETGGYFGEYRQVELI